MFESDLLAFIRKSVRSVWALEILLLLRKKHPASIGRAEIVQTLRATPRLVDDILGQLQAEGLVMHIDDGALFEPSSEQLRQLSDKLASAADERPVALRDAIVSAPNSKLQDFANAFRLKGKSE